MVIALSVAGIAFAALCVWMTVRAFNSRKRRTKWTLAALLTLFVIYPLSIGPAYWLICHPLFGNKSATSAFFIAYRPVAKAAAMTKPTSLAYTHYLLFWMGGKPGQ